MELSLSNNSPRNTVLLNSEGQAIYKIVTPKKLGQRTTAISKISPLSSATSPEDAFVHLATIDWPIVGRKKLRMQGEEMDARSYLKRDGFFTQHRIFTAPDDRLYRWNMGALGTSLPKLEVADGSKQLVAEFHRKKYGILSKRRDAYLEILEGGTHILDQIVITWILVEKLRRDREHRQRQGNGGGI